MARYHFSDQQTNVRFTLSARQVGLTPPSLIDLLNDMIKMAFIQRYLKILAPGL